MQQQDRLSPGTLFAQRFRVEALAGSGGMGVVYRARDVLSGQTVALKLFHAGGGAFDAERFQREATLLSELRHPAIVGYIAHGKSPEGPPYLAMEWLEGEDVAQRLSRQPLTAAQSLLLIRRVAAALNQAHRHGIVHRDLKPANLFLRDRSVEGVTLLDFGIARRAGFAGQLTRTGIVVGTPDYMAPEQARGERDIGPPADIFALGCVLFECLIGHPPFQGEHVAAVLARILFEVTPRLRSLRPELPESIEALAARMLHKDPAKRPQDAAALLLELSELEISTDLSGPKEPARTVWRAAASPAASRESPVVSVLIAVPAEGGAEGATLDPISNERLRGQLDTLSRLFLEHGVQAEPLLDGSLVASLADSGESIALTTVKDRAMQVARLALLVREQWPTARVALATGRGQINDLGRVPIGEVFENAVRLLHENTGPGGVGSIVLDAVTAGLLDARFQVRRDLTGAFVLDSAEQWADETRPLLGKPTPCVGRELELQALDATFLDCIEESAPRALLVTAPPGIGKSRLRHEFLRRVCDKPSATLVLLGRGDPLSVGAPFGLLGQALRQLCGIFDGEASDSRRAKLRARVAARVPTAETQRIAEFLGEVASVPFPDDSSMLLRAARQDPQVMADQTGRAWVDFLNLECAFQPTVIVLEDLHWGDAPTVRLCRLALQSLTDKPLFLLALGRPEVEAILPKPFPELTQRIELRPLGKRAGEKLVRKVLGPKADSETVARIVEQAAGNALFLEELIRAVAEDASTELPKTVMAILQERIGRLEAGSRQALRAASVFGETLWLGGIQALLGGMVDADTLVVWMQLLCRSEILEERLASRIAGEKEYHFRHALMRDAAYDQLSEEERLIGHRLAGQFLEARGEADAVKLAEHFRRGQHLERAIHYYTKAAEQALEAFDLDAAISCADRGLGCGPQGEARGALLSIKVATGIWREAWEESLELMPASLPLVPEGGVHWCRQMRSLFPAALLMQRLDVLQALASQFLTVEPDPEARGAYIHAGGWVTAVMSLAGNKELAWRFLTRIQSIGNGLHADDRLSLAHLRGSAVSYYIMTEFDPWRSLITSQECIQILVEAGDQRLAGMFRRYAGQGFQRLGDPHRAELQMREHLRIATQLKEPLPLAFARAPLAMFLSSRGALDQLDEAEGLAREVLTSKSVYMVGLVQGALSQIMARRGDLDGAETWARRGCEMLKTFGGYRWELDAKLLRILIQKGKIEAAARTSVEVLATYERTGLRNYAEVDLRLAVVEAHQASGELDAARIVLRKALDMIHTIAALIPDPSVRASYLTQVPENARVQALATEWFADYQGAFPFSRSDDSGAGLI